MANRFLTKVEKITQGERIVFQHLVLQKLDGQFQLKKENAEPLPHFVAAKSKQNSYIKT